MAIDFAAVCLLPGVEIAQPLLRQKKMHGALKTPAKFSPTWNCPVDAVPSPKKASAQSSFFEMRAAIARPAACGICVPTGDEIETMLSQFAEWCTGIWRPLTGSSTLPCS